MIYRKLSQNYKKVYPPVNIQKAIENGPFIDDLPIKDGDVPSLCKRLPEGISPFYPIYPGIPL